MIAVLACCLTDAPPSARLHEAVPHIWSSNYGGGARDGLLRGIPGILRRVARLERHDGTGRGRNLAMGE